MSGQSSQEVHDGNRSAIPAYSSMVNVGIIAKTRKYGREDLAQLIGTSANTSPAKDTMEAYIAMVRRFADFFASFSNVNSNLGNMEAFLRRFHPHGSAKIHSESNGSIEILLWMSGGWRRRTSKATN